MSRRVTFENIEFAANSIGSPLNLLGGTTLIYNCKIIGTKNNNDRDGIVIRGRSVNPIIRNVIIEGILGCGMIWIDGSTGLMNECLISNCSTVSLFFLLICHFFRAFSSRSCLIRIFLPQKS
jgi:hypothetical protein